MAKVLVVRKPDRTIHQLPIGNKARIMGHNRHLPLRDKWVLEEMDEKEAAKLPFFDTNFIGAAEAKTKLQEKDDKIKDLEAKLEALKAAAITEPEKVPEKEPAKAAEPAKTAKAGK